MKDERSSAGKKRTTNSDKKSECAKEMHFVTKFLRLFLMF